MANAATVQKEITVDSGKVYQNNRPYTGWYSTGGGKSIIRLMESVQKDGAKQVANIIILPEITDLQLIRSLGQNPVDIIMLTKME